LIAQTATGTAELRKQYDALYALIVSEMKPAPLSG
jgi:hypothetical protein